MPDPGSPYDVAVVGGGIVGLSTARALAERDPGLRVVVLEKEDGWSRHQTGRNSGVIHSGLYYAPGSLKARYAVEGARRMVEFCRDRGLPVEVTGKVVVATAPAELPRLAALHERGLANGIPVRRIEPAELREREPHVAGLAALHVASTGICDYVAVSRAYADIAAAAGTELRLGARVEDVAVHDDGVTLTVADGAPVRARLLVNCAGLHSDRLARLAGSRPTARIVPFRGEYVELVPSRRHLVRGLVYPVPDPAFPFLGVHFTRGVDGGVHAGPNAVPGLEREGYRRWSLDVRDTAEVLGFSGFWRLARRHWREGLREMHRSASRSAFVASLQRLVPDVTAADVVPAAPGVRAQAVLPDGRLVDDFLLTESARAIHVLNAPSPAATASLPIGDEIAARVAARFTR